MIKAVLFDLDDTLLDINLTAFVCRYLACKADVLSRISGLPRPVVLARLAQAYLAVGRQDREDHLTNETVLNDRFRELTGIPMDDPAIADALDYFDANCVDGMRGGIVTAVPRRGAREAIEVAQSLGLTVALATQPTFSLAVDEARMRWAEVDDVDFALVSHIANSTRTKPSAAYYQEFTAALGLAPSECLMVGNDATRDFPRPDIGLRTAYVGHGWPVRAVFRGPISELGGCLPQLVELLDERPWDAGDGNPSGA